MAELVSKWLLHAGPQGLLLRAKNQTTTDVHIEYSSANISSKSDPDNIGPTEKAIEIHGIVGILNLVASSHLIVITQTEEVAKIRGKAVYAIRDVVLISLESQSTAESVIANTQAALKQPSSTNATVDAELSDVEEDGEPSSAVEQPPEASAVEPPKGVLGKTSSLAKNVVQQPSRYSKFAKGWFGKSDPKVATSDERGGTKNDDSALDLPKQEDNNISSNEETLYSGFQSTADKRDSHEGSTDESTESDAPKVTTHKRSAIEMLSRRIQRTTRLYFSSSGFYFSYDQDISARLGESNTPEPSTPLWKHFDNLYFWNYNLINPFIQAGRHELVIPLMQGFVGQREVTIERAEGHQVDSIKDTANTTEGATTDKSSTSTSDGSAQDSKVKSFLLTLISRRSVERAGLRYLRRGVDDDGNVANAVETEQILSPTTWNPSDKIYSLTQTRGSIPLHFTQSPYSFKPTAVIHGSESTNITALKKHFTSMASRYGKIQAVSLVDKHPPESSIGQLYEDNVKKLNESNGIGGESVGFEWFDFHGICKGMKFEKVSILISSLENQLKSFGWTVEQNGRSLRQQSGILRTNCMDCLDRSNVVQSAIASWILERQLAESGLHIDLNNDPKTQWFNSLWADNGDAISKQYAGTAALKGDFTRTRKRNWTGALSDFSLSINRYYNNIFGDYFMQTCIDYYLGNAGPAVFDDFETDMMAKDYALDMPRIRQNAIDSCVKTALEDPEEGLLDGWTLSCPNQANTLRTLPFEECVVLLTKVAFYFCRFDWETEKVSTFEKVVLSDIKEIWYGAYVTNAFGTNLDETKNVGFALRYNPAENFMVRRNTRTLGTDDRSSTEDPSKSDSKEKIGSEEDKTRLLAFKALPPDTNVKKPGSGENMNEIEFVKHVCENVHTAVEGANTNVDAVSDQIPEVEERPIISAAQAKKNTGYAESIGYSLKKLVWS